jgi:hypothetical protein
VKSVLIRMSHIVTVLGNQMLKILLFVVLMHSSSPMVVRNASGKLIGKIYSNGVVRDDKGSLLGQVRNGSTYDANGRRLLNQELPGYLLK